MVVVSIIPNIIPLLLTGAIMGYFGIAIKPSTILVFSIAFGISVDGDGQTYIVCEADKSAVSTQIYGGKITIERT